MCYMILFFVFFIVSEFLFMIDKIVIDCIIYGCMKVEMEEEDVKC